MDAVKAYLIENNGDVTLNFFAETEDDSGYVPFEIIVSLPNTLFFEAKSYVKSTS